MSPRWESLLDENSLRAVLPPGYVHFARPIRDALAVFLGGLPEADQAEVLRAQAGLPLTATFSQRLGLLARNCPVLHKLGQVLARDQRLAPELRLQLRELESLAPTVSLETIQELLTAELGPLDRRGVTLLPPAIAEASVAVVIPFRQDGCEGQGVFKVLKPGIEERLDRELALLARVGEYLDQRCDELQIPHLDYREAFEQVRDKLRDEVLLEHEQRHLQDARAFFDDEPRVQVPRLFDHCTSRVTAMERVSGSKVTSHRLDSSGKKRLAGLLARALIAMPVFSRNHEAMFHGDPHAGNLFLTDDGRLAILDWSLVGRLGEDERIAVTQIILGAVTLDAGHVVTVLEQISDRSRLDVAALKTVVESWLRHVRRGQLPGLSWLIGMLDDATQNARLRVGTDLMLFRKSLHTLEGVVADVGQCGGLIDRAMYIEFLKQFVREWPERWVQLPQSRDYATRLSNLDLTRTLLSGPTAAARFWTGHTIDMLEALADRCAAGSRNEPEETCPSKP